MKAVVLVGGEGTRLRPLTFTTPKQMLPIAGQPMLERVLLWLRRHGVDEAILSLGYLPDAFIGAYPGGVAAGVALSYAVEPEPLDTAGAVRFAAAHGKVEDTFVVVNGDVLTDLDLSALVAFHRRRRAEGTIHVYPVADPSRFGVVPTDGAGRVEAFVEKPPRDEAPTNRINAGTYVLEPSVLDRIPPGRRVSIERETFPAMVRDRTLYAMEDDSYWLDAGTPAAYLQANRDLVEGRRGSPPVAGAHEAAPGVWVVGSPILAGEVRPSSLIGDGSVVEAGATIERSVLGTGCLVVAGSRVVDSVLHDGVTVAGSSTVSESIVGARATVGERCEIGGLCVLGQDAVVASGSVLDAERVPA